MAAQAGINIVEVNWSLTRTVNFSGDQAAHYNPIDGLLYVGRRGTGTDGLYRINADGSAAQFADGTSGGFVRE